MVRARVHGRSVYLVPRDGGMVVGATQYEAGFDTAVTVAGVRDLIADNNLLREQLQTSGQEPVAAAPAPAVTRYEQWFATVFGVFGLTPNTFPATSCPAEDPWGARVNDQMVEVETAYAEALLTEIEARAIPGAIVEFGVFRGG